MAENAETFSKLFILGSTEVDQFSIPHLKLTEEEAATLFENDMKGQLIDKNKNDDDEEEEDEVSNDDAGGITLKHPLEIRLFSKMKIVNVACGAQHTVAINSVGKVYTWGQNDTGTLGRTNNMDENSILYKIPGLVEGIPEMESATAGDCHTILYNATNNQIFFMGLYKNDKREYYDPLSINNIYKALNTLSEEEKKSIENGDVKESELKIKIAKYLAIPVEISLKLKNKKIASVMSGGQFSMFLTKSCELYTRGDYMLGNLGIGDQTDVLENSCLKYNLVAKNISEIFACYDHSFYKTKKCQIYAYGSNTYGQLATESDNIAYTPLYVEALSKDKEIAQITGGQEFTVATTANQELFTFGNALYGKLGVKITPDIAAKKYNEDASLTVVKIPQLVSVNKVDKIFTDGNYSYAITEGGELYSWGMGTSYVLGGGKDDDSVEPAKIDNLYFKGSSIRQIALGSGHAVFLAGPEFSVEKKPVEQKPRKRKSKKAKGSKRAKKAVKS